MQKRPVVLYALASVGAVAILIYGGGLLLVWIGAPFAFFKWEYEEYQRLPLPDGRYEAVVLRGNAGAVSRFTYDIFIVAPGRKVDRDQDRRFQVFGGFENTWLESYAWTKENAFTIVIGESAIELYKPAFQTLDSYGQPKEGDVVLVVDRTKR